MSAILKVLPMRRGPRPNLPTDQRCIGIFPASTNKRPRIYAIAFEGGIVKVGKTSQPRSRLRDHWLRGNGQVLWVHLFAPMHDWTAKVVEGAMPTALADVAEPVNRSEWYRCTAEKAVVIGLIRACIDAKRVEIQKHLDDSAKEHERAEKAQRVLSRAGLGDMAVSTYRRKPWDMAA